MAQQKKKVIVGMSNKDVVALLNRALADEWLAFYQYWIGAKVAKGPLRPSVVIELEDHAKDEFEHATKLANRIVQLEGTPLLSPQEWFKHANCNYLVPSVPHVVNLLKQNIKGEECAIEVYKTLIREVEKSDPVTYHMALGILRDEEEHQSDLRNLLEDIQIMQQGR